MIDILIKNVMVVDGTGAPAYRGSVGVVGDKIVHADGTEAAKTVIEGEGLYVSPGFIDAHSHGDLILGDECARLCKTSQGVTTEIGGQCGLSAAPVTPEHLALVQGQLSVGALAFPEDMQSWTNYRRYLHYADAAPKTANIKSYVGHSTLRIAVMGFDNREPTEQEMETMKGLLKEAMENGAAGFSTGLIYTPCCYATTDEIVELAKVIKPYGGIYASHMRNESYDSVKAVEETIEIGRRAGVPVFISHHKILGKANWGLQKQTLAVIQKAIDEGVQVTCDQYPYPRNMTHLNACVPPWHFTEGVAKMAERLESPAMREKIRREMEDPKSEYDNYYINAGGWEGVFVSSSPNTPGVVGKTVAEYAAELGQDPFETFFDIMVENKGVSSAVYSSMCDEDVFEIAQFPHTVVGSDGLTRALDEKGHPRAYGTCPRAICYYHKENGVMTLEEVIRKMTSMPAARLGMPTKGVIKDGNDADLVVFNYEKLQDKATYTHSNELSDGIEYVIVNGGIVYRDKKLTGVHSGRVLRHFSNGAQ
ncbi:aminoacylase [Leminorella grimontii]|uniref:Aminoacylase n=1 Tax=Leminorella grimontii TaxID=82981 RepID=A0AAV5N5M1_9GAMM|nr:D-aminoacylase [Leminorella grimontii]KFC94433.1 N-acyl-D-amino-acid deacylase [Leminorella grimontii ATCC 33999 = DSM 5078]GKX57401.1 aminoacylase [Leminorella grimontii]VFS54646.1 D-aminoacylase [Leminorella grimontii]